MATKPSCRGNSEKEIRWDGLQSISSMHSSWRFERWVGKFEDAAARESEFGVSGESLQRPGPTRNEGLLENRDDWQ